MRLPGKTAIVTGGAGGIGRGLAERFATEGANVVMVDLDRAGAEAAAQEITARSGRPALGLAVDVTDEDAVGAAVEEAAARFGGVDILVNNAGIQVIGAVDQLAFRDWKRLLAVHLDGAFLMTRACVRHMYPAGKGGCILFMGSVHSKMASVLKAPYVTAKHGLLGLCRTVAKEGAPYGVRANLLCPGYVRTALVERQIPEQAKVLEMEPQDVVEKIMLKDTLDREFTSIEEIGEAAVFLAEQKTLVLTGQSMMVSHGWLME